MNLKTKIFQNENNEIYFIGSISKDYAFFHTNHNQENFQYCYVLTNNLLYIQNFTANAVSYLGLSSGVINNNIEITFFIKQFYEEFLQIAIEYNNQLSSEQKIKIKRNILIKKYKNPVEIIWRRSDVFESNYISTKIDIKSTIYPKNGKNNILLDDIFLLVVNDVIINKKLVGYIFRFEKINFNNTSSSKVILPSINLINKQSLNLSNSIKMEEVVPQRINYSNDFNVITNTKNDFYIDYNFIPNSKLNFKFNLDNLSFKKSEELTSNYSMLNEMRDFVLNELEKENKKLEKKEKEEENEEESEEDEDSSEDESHSSDDNKKATLIQKKKYK